MLEGLLNVLKPPGITSHDLVDEARRLTGVRRLGHTGTLDPAAAGMMILMLGAATRLSRFLSAVGKVYRAEITLGIATDTLDGEGVIVAQRDAHDVTADRLRQVLAGMTGDLELPPPMYSAVRHQGRRLYELAREGKQAQVEARRMRVERFELLDFEPGPPPRALAEVACSKGTYVRSLAAEVGERLGCGAHLSFLVRTAVGARTLSEAATLEELRSAAQQGRLPELIVPLSDALGEAPKITVGPEAAAALAQGRRWPLGEGLGEAELVSVLTAEGRLLCVAQVQRSAQGTELQPRCVFAAAGVRPASRAPAKGGGDP